MQFANLPDYLVHPAVFIHHQPHVTSGAAVDRGDQNPFQVIGSTRKESAYMGHDAGMVVYDEA
jgi:hypothetical protein